MGVGVDGEVKRQIVEEIQGGLEEDKRSAAGIEDQIKIFSTGEEQKFHACMPAVSKNMTVHMVHGEASFCGGFYDRVERIMD